MLKFFYPTQKTNSHRPTPWHWSLEPFPALRGSGARYSAFLAVARDFEVNLPEKDPELFKNTYQCPSLWEDEQPCKLARTEKGDDLLVSCSKEEDEKIGLITTRGGFRGGLSVISAQKAVILSNKGANMHCCPTKHLLVRFESEDGYIVSQPSRKSASSQIEIYSWRLGYESFDPGEFELFEEQLVAAG